MHLPLARHAAARPGATRVLAVALIAVMVALLAPPPARAMDQPARPDPGVMNPFPLPGEVLSPGAYYVGGLAVANAGVRSVVLRVDGRNVPVQVVSSSSTSKGFRGVATVAEGEHLVEVEVTDNRGVRQGRWWRFAVSGIATRRFAGADRYATSAAISRGLYGDNAAGAVVLARGDAFADALAGAPFARSRRAPVLLSRHDSLPPVIRDEIKRVLRPGSRVFLLGGTAALSPAIATAVKSMGMRPVRIWGPDRFATARAIAQRMPDSDTVIVASGYSFPDALAASSPAARDGIPIVLAKQDGLTDPTRQFLASEGFATAFVVGGEVVIGRDVVADIDRNAGAVVRLAGADRYGTAAAIAGRFFGATIKHAAITTGVGFADALSGGVHAAKFNAPLLLTPGAWLPESEARHLQAKDPEGVTIYGGAAVVSESLRSEARRIDISRGNIAVTGAWPAPYSTINTLDTIQVKFDRSLVLGRSQVHVTLNGAEVFGDVRATDANTLVFGVTQLPFDPAAATPYDVKVTVRADGGGDSRRYLEYHLTYVKLELGPGDGGDSVLALQRRLTSLGYWLGTPDGNYGSLTVQAVMAFQKVHGLTRSGTMDERTRQVLATAGRPTARYTSAGHHLEVDKTRQVLFIVDDGRVSWTLNTSTGTETTYTYEGEEGFAHTPEGSFTIFRQIDGPRESRLGMMWRPKYFTSSGHAIHGSASVPNYPASHGCVRLTYPAMDWVWATNQAPIGTRLYVYR